MPDTAERRAVQPPTTDLRRSMPFTMRAADDARENDGLTIDGYAVVFNRVTVIDSWEGRFRELLAPGSTKKSVRERTPKLQFDHGRHPLIGSIPIGRWETVEEASDRDLAPEGGLHTIGRLHDNWLIQPVRDAIREGSIDGMSFRFEVVAERWETPDGKRITDQDKLYAELARGWMENLPEDQLLLRTLKEVKVSEAGPVVWPAYDDTSVGVRSQVVIDLTRLNEPEQRRRLADAVLRADAIDADDEPDAHTLPAPRTTDVESAGEHADSTTGTPQATEDVSAEEHAPPTPTPRSRDPLRDEVERLTAYVTHVKKEAARYGG